jgi:CheY-like chemotaxis protein
MATSTTDQETILVADDDDASHLILHRAFRKANSTRLLKTVSDGEQAIRYLDGSGVYADRAEYPLPTLLLLDLKMPRKGGFEVLKWVREHPGFKRLPVVIFTTSDEPRDINRSYDLGANSYLVKTPLYPAFTELVQSLDTYWLTHNRRPVEPFWQR